jgi:hypothetical protein
MASVLKEVTVDARAPRCWAALRDFGALHERLAKGFVTNVRMVGEREREVTFANGAVARELLAARTSALMDAGLAAIKATLEAQPDAG